MPTGTKLIPIYTSHGDVGAFLIYPYLYNTSGEWIGWVTPEREVFSVLGYYVGVLTMDPRILRSRVREDVLPRREPPPEPPSIRPPARLPLPPTMAEVPVNMIDVLEEAPDLLPPIGYGDLLDDMN